MAISVNQILAQTMPPIEAGVSHEIAKWRAANYSGVRYKLNIMLEKGAALMRGDVEIRVNLSAEGGKNPLILDWRTTQFENDKDKPYANVVAVNDALDIRSQINNEHLLIPDGLLKTGENVIKIEFASPIKTSGAAVTRYVDKEDGAEYIYSLFVPSDASTAFPCFDQPDLKAKFKLSVNIGGGRQHPDWIVISNAKPELAVNSTWGAFYSFKETQPISTYIFAFAAGDFAELNEIENFIESVTGKQNISKEGDKLKKQLPSLGYVEDGEQPIKIYLRKSQVAKFKPHAAEVFRLNREGVKFLESYFDYKFPFPKYDLVLIPEFPFGGMEHAGATFLREDRVIFPQEPTANDYITRANVIFHEAAHQWFGDMVTMRWFDDLWLKEGFAEFMAYKTMEKVLPQYNAWKAFYERNKPLAYLTDSTKGTTPIYQEIPNLSAAKSAYGNIVYRKAPSFLRQAEFYLGEDKFQTAVRQFLKKHQFANANWQDLVGEFQNSTWVDEKNDEYYQRLSPEQKEKSELNRKKEISDWADVWVKQRGMPIIKVAPDLLELPYETKEVVNQRPHGPGMSWLSYFWQRPVGSQIGSQEAVNTQDNNWTQNIEVLRVFGDGDREKATVKLGFEFYVLPNLKLSRGGEHKLTISEENRKKFAEEFEAKRKARLTKNPLYVFPNYQDYGYGIFLLDEKSRNYILANIQNEKDDFLRAMMWGALWDSVREAELNPKDYIEFAIKNISGEKDELTVQTILGRVSTAMNYYIENKLEPPAVAGWSGASKNPPATAGGSNIATRLEKVLLERMKNAETLGLRITFYRALLNVASTEQSKQILKEILTGKSEIQGLKLKTKDKFDIVTRLLILGDADAPKLLEDLGKTEASDEAKRYFYAARAGIGTAENKQGFWNDFVSNKEMSESYIESAFVPFNSIRHADLTLPYLEKALAELPNLKRNRKIFFVNGWLAAFIGGQRDEKALTIVNKFLNDNPNLDRDLRLKVLEVADGLERSIKIRQKFAN